MNPRILIAIFVATPAVRAFVDPRDFESDFTSAIPTCSSIARDWIRASFHDAGTFNLQLNDGGADGSLQFELDRPENQGLSPTIGFYKGIVDLRGISMADAIAFGAVRAFIVCGSPAVNFRPGRIDATGPNPVGRLPSSRVSSNETLNLFVGNLGMSVEETVAIVGGGHTVAELDPANNVGDNFVKAGGFDSTVDKFDNRWFAETLANPGNTRVQSDANMLNDPEMKRIFEFFAAANENFFRPFTTSMEKMINAGAKFESSPSPAPAPQPSPAPEPAPQPSPAPEPAPQPSPAPAPAPQPSPAPAPAPQPSPAPEPAPQPSPAPAPAPQPSPAPEPAPQPSPAPAPAPQPSPAPAPAPQPSPAPEPAPLPTPAPAPEPYPVYYPDYYYADGGAQQLNAEASSAASLRVAPLVFFVSVIILWL
jgi:hypothetical protein